MRMSNFKIPTDQNDEFKLEMSRNQFLVKVTLISASPTLCYFMIKNFFIERYFVVFFLFLMLMVLTGLFFVLYRPIEEKKKYIIYSNSLILFATLFGIYLIYGIVVEKKSINICWAYLYPMFVFLVTGVKKGLLWNLIFYCILTISFFYSDFQPISLKELSTRFLISLFLVSVMSFFPVYVLRRHQQKMLSDQYALKNEIKEHEHAEEALRESEKNFKELYDNSPIGHHEFNSEGRITRVNRTELEILGYTQEEMLGWYVWDFIVEEISPESVKAKLAGRLPPAQNFERTFRRKDGTTFPALIQERLLRDDEGRIMGIRSTIQDITERKQADEKYRTIVSTTMDGFWIVDMQGRFLEVNDAYCHLIGYSQDELLTMSIPDVEAVERPEETARRIQKIREVGGDRFETRHKCKDGRIIDIEVSVNYMEIEGGRFFVFLRNITERKRTELERERLMADLEAKNKEMEVFVYTISHDLKAPLVSLNGFSGALQNDSYSQLGKEGKHYVERIKANVAHMEALITSLLELSRIGQVVGSIEEIDVAALLREIRDGLAMGLEEVGAEFVVQEPLPSVRADRGRIHQVFVNLIENVVKFRSVERALRIEVGCRQESGFYRFYVADNGIGIAPQYHEQIFTPFRRLHPEIEGVGIGLALVKKIVEHHGGRAWVDSEAGKGSTFYFTIPRG